MTCSPIPAARSQYLLDLLAQVPDPRQKRGRRHPLAGLLAVGVQSSQARSRSPQSGSGPPMPACGCARRAGRGPRRSGRIDVPARLRPGQSRCSRPGSRCLAVDAGGAGRRPGGDRHRRGQPRGAKSKGGKAPHLVAALAHGIGAVLGQVAVDEKSNEIPAVRDLLKAFASLASAVITMDAMHTQHDTAQVILGRGADYVMTVKGNMPTLYKQLKKLPWAAVPSVSAVSTDHGRRARRTIKAVLAPAWTGFDGAAQVAQLRRTVTKNGKKTVEVVYLIASDPHADPVTLAAWVRGHWEIENRLHWVRDVTYLEDKSLVRTGNAPRVMASLRSLAISLSCPDGQANIASANRHHARDPQRTLKPLQTA